MTRPATIQALKNLLNPRDDADLMNQLETMISDECISIDDVATSDLEAALVRLTGKETK